ncbi:MAG: hypothetical protein ABSF26_11390 [Thermoguttaceae bacterium]
MFFGCGSAALLVALGYTSFAPAQSATPVSLQKRSLTISTWVVPEKPTAKSSEKPTSVPPTPGPDCVVTCGRALPLSAVAFSPDGSTLAVGGYREVLLWDLVGAKLAKRVGVGQIGAMVQSVVFTKGGKGLAAAEGTPCVAGAVHLFDFPGGQSAASFQEPKGVVYSLALSPDGKLLAGGCGDSAAYVWNLEDKKLVTTLKDHALAVVSTDFSPDGKYLATGSIDKSVQVWEVGTWKPSPTKNIVGAPVRRCFIRKTQDVKPEAGRTTKILAEFGLVAGGRDGGTLESCGELRWPPLKAEMDRTPLDCVWVKGQAYVASSDSTVKVFDEKRQQFELATTLRGHSGWVYGLAANAEKTRVASASGDGSVKIWSVPDHNLLATLVQLSPGTDEWLIVSSQGYFATSTPGAIRWETSGSKPAPQKLAALENPEMVRQSLAGKACPPPAL